MQRMEIIIQYDDKNQVLFYEQHELRNVGRLLNFRQWETEGITRPSLCKLWSAEDSEAVIPGSRRKAGKYLKSDDFY